MTICQCYQHLFKDFNDIWPLPNESNDNNHKPYSNNIKITNENYMRLIELKYLLKILYYSTNLNYYAISSKCDGLISSNKSDTIIYKRSSTDTNQMIEQLEYLNMCINQLDQYIHESLENYNNEDLLPRIVRLCDKYKFSDIESDLFHLLVVVLGSRHQHVLNSFVEDDFLRRTYGLQRIARISEVDLEIFCNSERQHIKEGIVLAEEEQGVYFNLRVPRTAIQLFYNRKVNDEDLFIIAQTYMEEILLEESYAIPESVQSPIKSLATANPITGDQPWFNQTQIYKKRKLNELDKDISSSHPSEYSHDDNNFNEETIDDSLSNSLVDITTNITNSTIPLSPYPIDNQLEYLEDGFQLIALLVRGNAARIKDDMKKEGTKINSYWDSGEIKQGRRELQAKIKVQEMKISRRVSISKSIGIDIPRLETLSERLGLDILDKKIILLLIGKTVSPVVRTLMETLDSSASNRIDEGVTVGQALSILCQDFNLQIANRKYFYKSSKLMSNAIISLSRSRWHEGKGDLTDQRISLDRRVLDWAVGLDSEINELVEGSDLYEPKVKLDQVVLPPGQLDLPIRLCQAYEHFIKYQEIHPELKDKLVYGNSLVFLLYGKPGTGKTMTVNAVARILNKKVLLVDFGALTGKQGTDNRGAEVDLRGLFRESSMNNAVIFFDECESIFKSRSSGNDRLLNIMLTEIERYQGIVFLATNLAHELDEAMHRRITCIIEYRSPDFVMRRLIWQSLLDIKNNNSLENVNGSLYSLADDVDIGSLAIKYELTGGFIKNAVLSALLSALHKNPLSPIITQSDLIEGCKLQMRGNLLQKSYEDKVIPQSGLSELCHSQIISNQLATILRYERARSIIYRTNCIDSNINNLKTTSDNMITQQTCCLSVFMGPSGSGKRTTAKAIAFDLDRSIKMLHIAEVLGESMNTTLSSIKAFLQDARLADAVFVIDGFEHVVDDSMSGSSAENTSYKLHLLLRRLLDILIGFPGLVILICHVENPQNISLQRDFATKLFSFIRFTVPPSDIRINLWQKLLTHNVSLAKGISYIELGKKYELFPSSIASAISRAVAEAAMRQSTTNNYSVTQKDLLAAGEAEIEKLKSGNFELISKLFT